MPNGTLEGSKWKKKAVLDNDLVHRISLEEEQRAERDVGKALGPQGLSINGHGQIVQDPKEAAEKHANKQEGESEQLLRGKSRNIRRM